MGKNQLVVYITGVIFIIGGVCRAEPIIIDHTCIDIGKIPHYWIEQAKKLTFHYAHTSHGSQIISGMKVLENQDPYFDLSYRQSSSEGLPKEKYPPALRMYDGNPPETYINPNDYWDSQSGRDRTRAVVSTGKYNFSMWSWCGQQSSNSAATTQRYLDTLDDFETEFPGMRFIYMTGHTDGSGEDGNLNKRNEQIRDYCLNHDKILYDFADIESYDPDGNYYLDLNCNDHGDYWLNGVKHNWPDEWCAAHPDSDLCASCSCAHSKPLICNMKGRAFWWMMARLAGWDGTPAIPGDATGNGVVNFDDMVLLYQYWLTSGCGGCEGADLSGDGDVNFADLQILAENWLAQTAIPE